MKREDFSSLLFLCRKMVMIINNIRRLLGLSFKVDKYYCKDGTISEFRWDFVFLHREDGPAIERIDGTKMWYIDNKLHRTDGPAAEWANGSREWYVDGKRHRTDGPAREDADGDKWWYIDGKRHRIDGPAVEWANGDRSWYIDGRRHRIDGPAIEFVDGNNWWFIDGKSFTNKEFDDLIKQVNEMSLAMKLTDPRWWVRELGEKEVG